MWLKGCFLQLESKEEGVTSRDVFHLKCFTVGLLSILLPSLMQSTGRPEAGRRANFVMAWGSQRSEQGDLSD